MPQSTDPEHNGHLVCVDEAAKRRIRIGGELRRAVARNELHLQCQPIVDLISGRMVGVEALLRWQHPDLGMIAPAEFIPVAENSGLIADIGQWVLHAACAQMQQWHLDGDTELYVAINVSGRQLRRGLVRQLDAALAASGLEPSCVELEIAEQSLVDNIEPGIRAPACSKGPRHDPGPRATDTKYQPIACTNICTRSRPLYSSTLSR